MGAWLLMCGVYIVLIILVYVTLKKGWASSRNLMVGFRSIMSSRSEETWRYANNRFFKLLFILLVISLLIHILTFILISDSSLAFQYSRSFFGISFILLLIGLEFILIIKFNWNGQKRN